MHRTTIVRQAANLWVVKERLWGVLLTRMRWHIETVAAQLVARYHLKRIWARDT